MSQEPHANEEPGSVPAEGPGTQSAMADAPEQDRSEVPPQGAVPDGLAEEGEEQLRQGQTPGGRVPERGGRVPGAGDGSEEDPMHGSARASGTPDTTDRS